MKCSTFFAAKVLFAGALCGIVFASPAQAQHRKSKAKAKATTAQAQNLSLVAAFEQAYQKKQKDRMLNALMVPTTDDATLEKRYQWLRGYGPKDDLGSKHQPILFEGSRGSFVPTAYKVVKTNKLDASHYDIAVHESGRYKDEDGLWAVERDRHIKTTLTKGKWYVMDYYQEDNADDYGFFVDDMRDKMTKLTK